MMIFHKTQMCLNNDKKARKNELLSLRFCLSFLLFMMLTMSIVFTTHTSVFAEVVFSEDFENGWNDWFTDYGVWEVGECEGRNGQNCAATSLKGNYPKYTDSRLISPKFQLPEISDKEEIKLAFWQYFHYSGDDYGEVHIRVFMDNVWGGWKSIARVTSTFSATWALRHVDLSNYMGKLVQVAFYHRDNNDSYQNAGLYIDELTIQKQEKIVCNTFVEGFEKGWENWSTDHGVWQIEKSESSYSGNYCAGTIINGNYPKYTDSRLISPILQLPVINVSDEIILSFWQWFIYSGDDFGEIHVNVFENDTWSGWKNVARVTSTNSNGWTPTRVDLTKYMDKQIRLAFYHRDNNDSYQNRGWLIDDLKLILPNQCLLSVSENTFNFDSNQSTAQIKVTTTNDCQWTAKSHASWITITSEKTGTGNANISFAVAKNADSSARQGSISVSGNIITIHQDGISCSYTLSHNSFNLESSGVELSVDIKTSSACKWNVSTTNEWISIISENSGTGDGTIKFSVAQNTEESSRNGVIQIADKSISVSQKGQDCDYELSYDNKKVDEAGGQFNVNVISQDNCSWESSSDVDWISIVSGSNGSGNGNVEYTVEANTETVSRTGKLWVAGNELAIIQEGKDCKYILSESINYVETKGGNYSFDINTSAGCTWDVSSSVSWINITSGQTGTGNGLVKYMVSENSGTETRTGYINIEDLQYMVVQSCCNTGLTGIDVDMVISTTDIETSVCVSDGGTFWVALKAHDVSNLDTYQLKLNYDSKRLAFVRGLEDDESKDIINILKTNEGTTLGFSAVESDTGVIHIANSLVSSNCEKAPDGSGVLALIQFDLIEFNQNEPTNLFLSDVSFNDCHGYVQDIDHLKSGQILSCAAGAALDTDITTYFYDDTITTTAIEPSKNVLLNEKILIAVVAQGTSNLDTYEVNVSFDSNRLRFIKGYEDYIVGIHNIQNILKKYGGTTLGFTATERSPGNINMANTLVGKDKDKAPSGSGIMGVLEFEVLDKNSIEPIVIIIETATYVNSIREQEHVSNLLHAELIPNSCLEWDYNCDGIVNFLDLGLFADHWLFTCDYPEWSFKYDSNQDCKVNFLDLGEFADHWLEEKACECTCSDL